MTPRPRLVVPISCSADTLSAHLLVLQHPPQKKKVKSEDKNKEQRKILSSNAAGYSLMLSEARVSESTAPELRHVALMR